MTETDDSGVDDRHVHTPRSEHVQHAEIPDPEPSFVDVAKDIVHNRAVVLFSIVTDSILLAAASGVFLYVHHIIGQISDLSLVDQIVLVSVQVLTAIGTIGTLATWLVRDLRHAIARAWKG